MLERVNSLDALLAPDALNGTWCTWFFYLRDLYPAEGGPVDGVHLTFAGTGTPPGVPEPTSWAFMLLGFGLVGLRLRRERWRQASANLQQA